MACFTYTVPFSASVIAFQAVSYEYAVEMTYPLPEGTSGNIVNVVSQVGLILVDYVAPCSNNEIAGDSQGHNYCSVSCVAVGQTLVGVHNFFPYNKGNNSAPLHSFKGKKSVVFSLL